MFMPSFLMVNVLSLLPSLNKRSTSFATGLLSEVNMALIQQLPLELLVVGVHVSVSFDLAHTIV